MDLEIQEESLVFFFFFFSGVGIGSLGGLIIIYGDLRLHCHCAHGVLFTTRGPRISFIRPFLYRRRGHAGWTDRKSVV